MLTQLPKPTVLDMKWEIRDINVVALAHLSKCSMLDGIVTPIRLLELFFDDVLVGMIIICIKLYRKESKLYREKAEISLEITDERICFLLSILLPSECHKLTDHKIYWKTTPNAFV